jgi:hypothetical protein
LKQVLKYLFGFSLLFWSCDENSPKHLSDQDYFPLQVGLYHVYSVEQTEYTGLNNSTSTAYELKVKVIDSFTDSEGATTYVMHRSKRLTESDSWEFVDTWSSRINQFETVINEGVVSYVRLSFPVFESKEWDGNIMNSMPEDLYIYDHAGEPFQLDNGQNFSDCLVVNQEEYLDVLSKNDRLEVYARNVGLIYKKYIDINYCDEGDCFGQQEIKNGVEYFQVLKEYGEE